MITGLPLPDKIVATLLSLVAAHIATVGAAFAAYSLTFGYINVFQMKEFTEGVYFGIVGWITILAILYIWTILPTENGKETDKL